MQSHALNDPLTGRTTLLFFIAVATFSTGFGVMTPVVPIYAGIAISANAIELGMLGAFTALPYIFLPAAFGRVSDRIGRKPLLISGLLLYAAICIAYANSSTLLHLSVLRGLEGVCFSAIWPSSEAFIGDRSDDQTRPLLVGRYSVSWSFGYMVGPILLGALLAFIPVPYAFYGVAVFMAAGAVMVFAIKMPKTPKAMHSGSSSVSGADSKSYNQGMPLVIYMMVVWGFTTLSFIFLFPSYAGIWGISASTVSYLIGLMALVRTAVFAVYGRILATLGGWTLVLGMATLCISMLTSWVVPSLAGFAASVALLGLSLGLLYAYSLAFVLNKPAKGFYAGLFESAIGMGQLLGPLLMGYLAFISLPSAPYLALAILGAISAALTVVFMRGSSRRGL